MELLTVKEVSKILKINVSDTYKLIKKGYIEALKLGSLKVTRTELENFLVFAAGKDFSDLDNVKPLDLN